MRPIATMIVVLTMALPVLAQEGEKKVREAVPSRFDILPDVELYPQAEAKQTLASVVKALEKDRYDYVLAHLMDPAYVDQRLKESNASFAEMANAMRTRLKENPDLLKGLKLLLKEGETSDGEKLFVLSDKQLQDRKVYLVKVGPRWFLKNDRVEKK